MRAAVHIDGGKVLSRLAWDSDYFGFAVARITAAELDDAKLLGALRSARNQSIPLVYWATSAGRSVPQMILTEFQGTRVDQKTTFARELGPEQRPVMTLKTSFYDVLEHPRGPACPRLLALGVSAGHHSRFQTDPRIKPEQHRTLYEMWMQRSSLRELADNVFVAVARETAAEPIGVVTGSVSQGTGSIGLIAVHDSVRGQGIGTLLMEAAHSWMRAAGANRAEVVTQLANRGACRLYESCGYQIREVVDYYHFWPLAACGAG